MRQRAAYPVYDETLSRAAVGVVRDFIQRELPNLQLAGRNGMHKYNNQDHAMMTGLMAAWNIMGGSYDCGAVNGDALYLEAGAAGDEEAGRMIPRPLRRASLASKAA